MQNAATTDKSNFFIHFQFNGFKTFRKIEKIPPPIIFGKKIYEGENETYIEASAENSGSTLYDKEIRDKPRTRHTKRNV